MARASLSIVIVAHDSLADLRRALPALVDQLDAADEIVVVDNASRDGLAAALPELAPRATLVALAGNLGFAAGVNRGAERAGGDILVLLNPDAIVAPGWADAIRAPWGGPWAAWMGLVLMARGDAINTSGGVLHFTGFGWAGQVGRPVSEAPEAVRAVGFLSGACLAIPRRTWTATGGFPEHFFMYCEDVDLSLRLRLSGGTIAVVPDARVWHDYGFDKGDLKWRLLERNRWATVLRTYPAPLLVAVAPALVAAELAVWAAALRGGWGRAKARATFDLARALPRLLAERREVQAAARISAGAFAASMTADLDSPHLGSVADRAVIRRALALYFRGVRALLR